MKCEWSLHLQLTTFSPHSISSRSVRPLLTHDICTTFQCRHFRTDAVPIAPSKAREDSYPLVIFRLKQHEAEVWVWSRAFGKPFPSYPAACEDTQSRVENSLQGREQGFKRPAIRARSIFAHFAAIVAVHQPPSTRHQNRSTTQSSLRSYRQRLYRGTTRYQAEFQALTRDEARAQTKCIPVPPDCTPTAHKL